MKSMSIPSKLTQEQFLEKCRSIHGDRYNYSKFIYTNAKTKSIMICSIHGEFLMNSHEHFKGSGCPKCKGKGLTTKERIDQLVIIHKNFYSYSKFIYSGNKNIITVICPEHGEFSICYNAHYNGQGCYQCYIKNNKHTKEHYVDIANNIHNFKYDYSKFTGVGQTTKGVIICPTHGEFEQTFNVHIVQKSGCPICSESKGEKIIRVWLEANNIEYECQKMFKDITDRKFKFDFYIPSSSTVIEYDGVGHYQIIKRSKNQTKNISNFIECVVNDYDKNDICNKNGINIIRIPYWELDNIDTILNQNFNQP
jgi:very-short-patch-repair endonuclease